MLHLLLLNSDCMRSEVNVLGEVVQRGTFSINTEGSIFVAEIFLQQSFGRTQQPVIPKRG